MKSPLSRFLYVALPLGAFSGLALAAQSGDKLIPAFPPGSGRSAATAAPSSGSTQPLIATCLPAIKDQSGAGCIQASSVPTFGDLLPLSNYFNVTPAGKVGINTATPGATLHVKDANAAQVVIDGDNGSWLRYFDSGVAAWDMTGSFNDYAISRSGIDYPFLIEYATGNTRINAGVGNVGIGTTAPARKLDVVGTARVSGLLSVSGNFPIGQPGSGIWVNGNDSGPLFPPGTPEGGIRIFNNSIAPGASTIQGWDYFQNIGRDIIINDAGGNVGIGTASPQARLDVAGSIRCVTLTQTSAREFKQDIAPLTGALDSILKLQGVTYSWNDKAPEAVQGHEDIGFIADDVDAVLPEIVSKDESGKVLGLDYGKITPVAVEAIKELNAKNLALEARLAKLEALLASQRK